MRPALCWQYQERKTRGSLSVSVNETNCVPNAYIRAYLLLCVSRCFKRASASIRVAIVLLLPILILVSNKLLWQVLLYRRRKNINITRSVRCYRFHGLPISSHVSMPWITSRISALLLTHFTSVEARKRINALSNHADQSVFYSAFGCAFKGIKHRSALNLTLAHSIHVYYSHLYGLLLVA